MLQIHDCTIWPDVSRCASVTLRKRSRATIPDSPPQTETFQKVWHVLTFTQVFFRSYCYNMPPRSYHGMCASHRRFVARQIQPNGTGVLYGTPMPNPVLDLNPATLLLCKSLQTMKRNPTPNDLPSASGNSPLIQIPQK